MEIIDILDKLKGKLINLVVIIATATVVYNLYQYQNKQLAQLKKDQVTETKKLTLLENMKANQAELDSYKKLLTQVPENSIINTLSNFAKSENVQVESFKPEEQKRGSDYTEVSFNLRVTAKNYHDLAKFISKIENYSQVFIIGQADINTNDSEGKGVKANLRLSNIAYPENVNAKK